MVTNKDNTYLFLKGNKNKLVFNPPEDVFTKDFTLAIEFKPDIEHYTKMMKETSFYTQGLVCKNGKHIGLFFTAGTDEIGNILLKVSFEWWKKTDNPEVDEVKAIDFFPPSDSAENGYKVIIRKKRNEIELVVNGKSKVAPIENVIDYSYSYTWVGCANRLDADYQHIFYGDISKMHLQEGLLDNNSCNLLFNDYQEFVKVHALNRDKQVIFTSDFSQVTPYKVKDHSYNNNHIIKFSKAWLNT